MFGQFAQFGKEMGTWASNGFQISDQAEARMEICRACPYLNGNKCQQCGCFMPAKTKLSTSQCPIGKW